jgi:hypothetical protein
MIGIREYISIIGELSSKYDISAEKIIADLIALDTIATHFLQSGIQDLMDSNSRNDFLKILDSAVETELLKELVKALVNREELISGILRECSLITEHLTEITVDLSQYPIVTDQELEKLLLILQKKHPHRFMIVSVGLPDGNTITKYLNTFKHTDEYKIQLSELDTLLSLYMEVNSGA